MIVESSIVESSSSPVEVAPTLPLQPLGEPTLLHAAHDIGNVLAALKLRMALLMRDEECQRAQGHNLEIMKRILDHGSAITSSMFCRAAGREHLPRTSLQVAVGDAVEIATGRRGSGAPPIRFVTHLTLLPAIIGSRDHVTRVFANLLINASDAMPDGGEVEISGHVEDGAVVVIVEDDGPGIPAAMAEQVFKPGFTTKRTGHGGLGLAIVAEIMESLSGSVDLVVRPGCGTRLELRFPPRR